MAKVSIIVPVYNTEQYLKECVESLLSQTLRDIEIILVDDGSTDNSAYMCDKFQAIDSRIKVIHKVNGGLSSARNAAIDICSGAYIGFVDSDDFVKSTMFEELYNSAIDNDSDIVMCALSTYNNDKVVEKLLPFEKNVYHKDEILDNFILPLLGRNDKDKIPYLEGFVCRQIFRKSTIEKLYFKSEREYFAEDVMFDFEVYPKCNKISVVNKSLYYYRYNEKSLSNKYRSNVWDKLYKYLKEEDKLIENLMIRNNPSVKIRFNNLIIQFIIFSILNLSKPDCDLSDKQKLAIIEKICTNEYFMHVNNFEVYKTVSKKTVLFLILLKLKFYRLVLILTR